MLNRCSRRAGSPQHPPVRRFRRVRLDAVSTGSPSTAASASSVRGGTIPLSGITARSAPTWPWSRPPEPTYRFGVPYATRPMHDADSHIMEEPDWLHPYLDAATRQRFPYVWSVG